MMKHSYNVYKFYNVDCFLKNIFYFFILFFYIKIIKKKHLKNINLIRKAILKLFNNEQVRMNSFKDNFLDYSCSPLSWPPLITLACKRI